MNMNEIVRALRNGTETCAECRYYGEPCGCNRPDGECDGWDIGQSAADQIESLQARLVEYDALAAKYGIDGKTMLTLAESQIKTAKENIVLQEALEDSQRRAQDARNELCLRCGRYKEAHNGACDGCRWKET